MRLSTVYFGTVNSRCWVFHEVRQYRKRPELKLIMSRSFPLQRLAAASIEHKEWRDKGSVTCIISESFRALNISQQITRNWDRGNVCLQGRITTTSRGQHCLDNRCIFALPHLGKLWGERDLSPQLLATQ